jgi:hypothetical protein
MSTQGFKFDSSQQYQLDAIAAAVDLFDGQPQDAEQLVSTLRGTSVNLSPEEVEAAGAATELAALAALEEARYQYARVDDKTTAEAGPVFARMKIAGYFQAAIKLELDAND